MPDRPSIGIGTSGLMGSGSRSSRQNLLESALAAGVTHVDTAPLYGAGYAEAETGRLIKASPAVSVATKFGLVPTGQIRAVLGGARRRFTKTTPRKTALSYRREFAPREVEASIERSLARLGRSYLDVILAHEVTLEEFSDHGLLRLMTGFVDRGLVRTFGIATSQHETFRLSQEYGGDIPVVQFELGARDNTDIDHYAGRHAWVITHRSLYQWRDVHHKILQDRATCERLEALTGATMSSQRHFVAALLSCARRRNSGGTVLFSTTNESHAKMTAQILAQPMMSAEAATEFSRILRRGLNGD